MTKILQENNKNRKAEKVTNNKTNWVSNAMAIH